MLIAAVSKLAFCDIYVGVLCCCPVKFLGQCFECSLPSHEIGRLSGLASYKNYDFSLRFQ